MTNKLAIALVELERDKVVASVTERATGGEDPLRILEECREGMTLVGELVQVADKDHLYTAKTFVCTGPVQSQEFVHAIE